MSENEELLFFDTFAHGTTEELNLDLVQFPKPVYIHQIRVIPLGAKVQADFPGGVRLGATNPSQFKLELFVNDLSKPGASAFETLGVLDYNQNSNIHYDSDKRVPTDGLVLRGWYTTVTLAVYGVITRAPIITVPPPPPPPIPQPAAVAPATPVTPSAPTTPTGPTTPTAPLKSPSPVPAQPPQPPAEPVPVVPAPPQEKAPSSPPPVEEKIEKVKSEEPRVSKNEEVDREKEQEKEFKVKVEEKVVEKPREKSRRSDDSTRTRDSGEHRDREWDSDRAVKIESDRSSRSEHRSRHDGERSKSDADRSRSESDKFKSDPDRSRSESDRERARTDSDRKRADADRVKSERSDSDRTRGDSERTRGETDRNKSDSDRVRNESERTRSERSERSESDRLKNESDHVRSETERVRTDDRKDRSRSERDRDRDRERRSERSDRKGRSKERDRNSSYSERDRSRERSRDRPRDKERAKEQRESSRRPRTPPEDKKNVDAPPPSAPSPLPPAKTPPATPVKKDEQPFECFSPGVEMEAISDDEMPEIDNVPSERLDDAFDDEPNDAELESHDKKADSTAGEDVDSSMQEVPPSAEGPGEGADEPEEFEEILSDEDLMFDDYGNDMAELEALDLPELADIGKPVNPYAIELQPLQYFTDPSFTAYQRLARAADRSPEPEEAAARLKAALEMNSRGEKWLDSISQIMAALPSALAYLKCQGRFEELDSVEGRVIEWLVHGLDFDRALEQVGPSTLTVRHIKTGLKLVHCIAQSSPGLLQRAIDEGAMAKILSLYAGPHMALSLKLMCLRSLDALLAWPYAMERWRGEPISDSRNGYEHLVKMIEAAQPSRAQVSLAALFKKVKFYESLERVHEIGQALARLSNRQEQMETSEMDDSTEKSTLEQLSTEILAKLGEIRQVYLNPQLSIGHFVRFLPVHRQFEIAKSNSNDPLESIYSYMRHHRFLHVLLLLLTHPSTASNALVVDRVLSFLEEFRRTQHGLCFMAAQPDVTSLILRVLLHSSADSDEYPNADETNVTGSPSSLHRVGLQLAYALHAVSCLDALNCQAVTHGKEKALHMIEPIQSLYSMVFNTTSRLALIHVLGLDSNLDVLITFLTNDSDAEIESKLKESAMRGYATELVALVVRFTENASFYAKYGNVIHELVSSNQDESSKLNMLTRWAEVAHQAHVFTLDSGLPALCEVVKQHADDAANFPPELIVALRLVCPLAIESADREESNRNVEDYVELKYAYAMVQLFSHDMLSTLTGVLTRLCQAYEQPSVHSAVLAGPQGALLLSVVHPSLRLIRRLLSHVIRCRDADFHDLTAVPVLLQTYALVNAVPASCLFFHKASECCSEIIATLLAYSQPAVQANDEHSTVNGTKSSTTPEDAISRSLWTQMIQEVLKSVHSCSGPTAAVTGLQVLNELLPLPLPLFRAGQSKRPMTGEDALEVVNARKLWSVHLHTLGPLIQQVVRMLCCAGPQLLPLLRKVCVQIGDLSAGTALVIARAALDALLTSCNVNETGAALKSEDTDKEVSLPSLPSVLVCSVQSARILNFLAAVVTHAPIKAAVLQLCRGLQKSDEKYVELMPCLCLILNSTSAAPAHVQSQECVVTIFNALLDADICLLPAEKLEHDVYLSAALPSRELLVQIATGLLDHVTSAEPGSASVLSAVRTISLFTEHNYTFGQLQRAIDRKRYTLRGLLDKLAVRNGSESFATVLLAVLELLRSLARPGEATGKRSAARSLTVPIGCLATLVQWKKEGETAVEEEDEPGRHPLLVAQDALDESMQALREALVHVIDLLNGEPQQAGAKRELVESVIQPADPLSVQFAQRPVVCDAPAAAAADEERLASAYWINAHWQEEADGELVRCDLIEIAQSCLGSDYDLAAAIERVCKLRAEPHEILGHHGPLDNGKSRTEGRANEAGHPPGRAILSTARDKSNKPYVAPMRGRGFGRPGVNSRNDPFRSRAPNTSRPPSLHVDDFVALEKNGAVGGSTPGGSGAPGNLYGAKAARGGGRSNGSRTRGSFAGERARFGNFGQPRREATRTRPGASASSSSGTAPKWDDVYHPAGVEARTASRFPQAGRTWTGSSGSSSGGTKERYTSPTGQTPASRVRHARTFSR